MVVTGQCIGPAANMMSLGEGKRTPCTTNTKPIGTDTCNIQTIYHTVVVGWRRQRASVRAPPNASWRTMTRLTLGYTDGTRWRSLASEEN